MRQGIINLNYSVAMNCFIFRSTLQAVNKKSDKLKESTVEKAEGTKFTACLQKL